MKTTHGIAEGEWKGSYWLPYRWESRLSDSEVLSWMKLSDLEKQGEQKQDPCDNCKDVMLNCHNFPCIKKRAYTQGKSAFEVINEEDVDNANKVEPKDYSSIEPHFGKPVDNVEPFDKYEGLTDFERTLADICIGWIGEEPGWEQYINDGADVLLKIAIKKFNSVQDQNTAWSEEDEDNILMIEDKLRDFLDYIKKDSTLKKNIKNSLKEEIIEYIDWLKSLKERVGCEVNCTTTKEWSEEDEEILSEIIYFFEKGIPTVQHDFRIYASWLKSLKQRYTWKPSDKQINALEHFVRSIGESGYASPYENNTKLLYSLLEQLKKLKGE
jgi:hypothetical protein